MSFFYRALHWKWRAAIVVLTYHHCMLKQWCYAIGLLNRSFKCIGRLHGRIIYFLTFLSMPCECGVLVPDQRASPHPLPLKHWTTRGVPRKITFDKLGFFTYKNKAISQWTLQLGHYLPFLGIHFIPQRDVIYYCLNLVLWTCITFRKSFYWHITQMEKRVQIINLQLSEFCKAHPPL